MSNVSIWDSGDALISASVTNTLKRVGDLEKVRLFDLTVTLVLRTLRLDGLARGMSTIDRAHRSIDH